jgi:protein ImuB
VRRDYFIAIDGAGRRLWIFRDPRPPGGWFLQGMFA